jgi:hypothetical protein
LIEYYALIADLPRPTEVQFALQVCFAHRWYKHLPLEGAEFVVFVDLAPASAEVYITRAWGEDCSGQFVGNC